MSEVRAQSDDQEEKKIVDLRGIDISIRGSALKGF